MSGYLIDTNAISLLSDNRASAAFSKWLEQQQQQNVLFVSSITLQEIQKGITKLDIVKGGNTAKVVRLRLWFEALILDFQDKILPVDAKVALMAGEIEGAGLARGHNGELADILIAATGQAHGLSVITANLRDFEPLGVPCLAPF